MPSGLIRFAVAGFLAIAAALGPHAGFAQQTTPAPAALNGSGASRPNAGASSPSACGSTPAPAKPAEPPAATNPAPAAPEAGKPTEPAGPSESQPAKASIFRRGRSST